MNNIVNFQCLTPETKTHSFVDTLHGLTDKLHQLRHDDKSKSGKFLSGIPIILKFSPFFVVILLFFVPFPEIYFPFFCCHLVIF